jgi:hypothetical protein
VVGIGLVLRDVLADRARRKALLGKFLKVYAGTRIRSSINDVGLSSDPKRMARRVLENERQLRALEANTERADELVRGVLVDLVSTECWWRLLGPALVVFGIVVGMAANICASA